MISHRVSPTALRLWRAARTLAGRGITTSKIPRLLFFTDPARTPDPIAVVATLPRGAGVVFRAFGADDARARGRALAAAARRRGVIVFVGADPVLARRVGARGVHLPQRSARRAGDISRLRRRFLVTGAAHDLPSALRAEKAGVQAVIVSAAFASASPSAGGPLGARGVARIARRLRAPVFALGGVDAATARRLRRTGARGLAAVGALAIARSETGTAGRA